MHALVDYTLMFLGAQANDPAMIPITNYVNNSLLNAGHTGFSYNALSKNSALMYLSTSRVFACITHGSPTLMVTSDGYITVEDIAALDSNAFNDLAFIFLAACETGEGEGSSENLVNALYAKGAWAVLGFTRKVLVEETNYWSQQFMQNLANGMSYDDAMRAADKAIRAQDEFLGRKEYSVDGKYRHFVGNSLANPWE